MQTEKCIPSFVRRETVSPSCEGEFRSRWKQIDCGLGTGAVCSVEDRSEEGGVGQNLSPSHSRNRGTSDNGLGYE